MKSIVWPLIHTFRLRPEICLKNNSWGWISQNKIREFANESIPENNISNSEMFEDRTSYHGYHFRNGVRQGYIRILDSYYNKDDFLENNYTTPKLSFAINHLNSINNNKIIPEINVDNLKVNVLGSWIETGIAKSNDKILGLWNKEQLRHELFAGGIGPEVRIIWDQMPVRQRVRVLYILKDRIDVWDWERCLMVHGSNWNVCNINKIIVSKKN